MMAMTEQERKQNYFDRHHEECLERHRVYMRSRRRDKAKDPWCSRNIEVIDDPRPVEEGGFRKGSQFSGAEIKAMLEQKALDNGTRIRNTDSREEFVVTFGKLVPVAPTSAFGTGVGRA